MAVAITVEGKHHRHLLRLSFTRSANGSERRYAVRGRSVSTTLPRIPRLGYAIRRVERCPCPTTRASVCRLSSAAVSTASACLISASTRLVVCPCKFPAKSPTRKKGDRLLQDLSPGLCGGRLSGLLEPELPLVRPSRRAKHGQAVRRRDGAYPRPCARSEIADAHQDFAGADGALRVLIFEDNAHADDARVLGFDAWGVKSTTSDMNVRRGQHQRCGAGRTVRRAIATT